MAVTDKRVRTIESELSQISQRLAKLEGHKEGVAAQKSPNAALVTVLSILGAAAIGYWGWIGTQVVSQGKQISQILAILSPEIIKKASSNPSSPKSAKQVEQVVQQAIKQGNRIDPAVVADAGMKFIEASTRSSDAWGAAITLVNYHSFLNTFVGYI
jgi:hypothetical protein